MTFRRRYRSEEPGWSSRGPGPLALVILLASIQVLGTRAAYGGPGRLSGVATALLVAGPVALSVRHRWPGVALVGALIPTTAYFALGYPNGPVFLAALAGIFTAVGAGHRTFTAVVVAVGYAGFAFVALPEQRVWRVAVIGVWAAAAIGFAEAGRQRSVRFAELATARAEQQERARVEQERARVEQERARVEQERARVEQERARREQARRQASEERLRIARELHDVLGHHLSLINVQAGVGLHLMDERPEQAQAALAAIKHASAEALRETRSVLAALHPGEESAPRAPAPGIGDLGSLAAEVNAAGLPVEVDIGGAPRPLPAEVDRAAYRIIQEALTNVRRHAGSAATARVLLRYHDGGLTVRVIDDGSGSIVDDVGAGVGQRGSQGTGIAGMRQRALALGGRVSAGPLQAGGFQVLVLLPAPAGPGFGGLPAPAGPGFGGVAG